MSKEVNIWAAIIFLGFGMMFLGLILVGSKPSVEWGNILVYSGGGILILASVWAIIQRIREGGK